MSRYKAIAYNPLPPLELEAETDRISLWLSCNSLQAALGGLHNFQATGPTERDSLPVLLYPVLPQ